MFVVVSREARGRRLGHPAGSVKVVAEGSVVAGVEGGVVVVDSWPVERVAVVLRGAERVVVEFDCRAA